MVLIQLPLTVIIGCVTLAAPVAWPGLLGEGLFQVSLLVHVLLFVLCWAVPWDRLPPAATLAIPVGDGVALILSRTGAIDFLPGLSVLMIFPVIWLAASGRFPKTAVFVSFVVPLVMGLVPLLLGSAEVTATQLATTVLVALMLLAVALTVRFVTATLFLQQRMLERKDAELRRLLHSSEERASLFKTILDTIDVGITAVDATGRIILRNRQQERFERFASGPDQSDPAGGGFVLYGQDRRTLLPEDRMPVPRAVRGETFADYYVWAGEGAHARALSTAARGITTGSGGFAGAVIAYNDVTSLVETVTAKDELMATVSHELRTPLTSIVGNLELAQDESELQAVSTYVDVAYRGAERLVDLVSDLLLSSSVAMTVHPRETDIAGLIDSVINSVSPLAAAAGIEIRTDVPAPMWTHADPLRMGQVLDNLLSNAIKYTPDGGVVAVAARFDGGQLTLEVQDTGMGISATDAAKVFDKFFRTKSVQASAIPGTGLGLSITKAIVEGHRGKISCRSEVGQGSTFTVSLPSLV
jgi:signal transduction histidine kinase/PAS domain-containing protein